MNVESRFLGYAAAVIASMTTLSITAQPKYGGGTGEANDPYQIATAADLIALGETPGDYAKHFILTADIDLDPNLPGRKVFDRAVIAPPTDQEGMQSFSHGTPFTGSFDGQGHTISRLTISGRRFVGLFGQFGQRDARTCKIENLGLVDVNIDGSDGYPYSHRGALVGCNYGAVTQCYSTGTVSGTEWDIGGLVGENNGTVSQCYSTAAVSSDGGVGGLVGYNVGTVTECYSTGTVTGWWGEVGGLVGSNNGIVDQCYSTGSVISAHGEYAGGLVGFGSSLKVTGSFWNVYTSGVFWSVGGTGRTTPQMQTSGAFRNAGWDFVGETKNGTEDIWWINEGQDYPRLVWQRALFPEAWFPDPPDGAIDVCQPCVLSWHGAARAVEHDVYFGDDKGTVANATHESQGIYRGRQVAAITNYDPGPLESGKPYYWRIDEVNEADPSRPWKGDVWSFTSSDSIVLRVVDDFESYANDRGHLIFKTWISRGGGWVGNTDLFEGPPYAEQGIVHGGNQSMPMEYFNDAEPWYSEAERTWETPQDWTVNGADALTLYFRGQVGNAQDPLYVAIEDSTGRMAVVAHPDPNAVLTTQWQRWQIPLADLRAAGVDVAAVRKLAIGAGDRNSPKPGGTGKIYIDDIRLTKRMP